MPASPTTPGPSPYKLVPITTHEQLDVAIALTSEIFTKEEGCTVVSGITYDEHCAFLKGLHEALDINEALGLRLSALAVHEETGEVGAAFIAIPAAQKHMLDESIKSFDLIGKMLDALNVIGGDALQNKDVATTIWFGFAAVLAPARGQGLQKRARRMLIEEGRAHGYKSILTECIATASTRSMLSASGLGTTVHTHATLPYDTYNGGADFGACVVDWGSDAATLIEEIL